MTNSFFFCAVTACLLAAGSAPAPRPTASPPLPRDGQTLYRRYRGELAGRPVVVEFTFRRLSDLPKEHQFDLAARAYDLATGAQHDLRPAGLFKPAAPLTLREETYPGTGQVWHASQPLGPVLSGTWQASALSPPQPFTLREDYTGAARFELLTEYTSGRRGLNSWGEPARSSITVTYLHLLGADTLRPALAPLQCPVPVRRRRERVGLDQVAGSQDLANIYDQSLEVTLNEQDLLASTAYTQEGVVDHRRAQHTWNSFVYDLRTGRQFGLLELLRPGADTTVQRLITNQLRRGDPAYAALLQLDTELLPLPEEDFALTPAGCQATYQTAPEDAPFYAYTVSLTWAQLRPLLRPGTPLDRLLQARGLPRPR
ncbi:hypothetical protein [Solirubrum puertoriconensis]|uniref:DUF3298 domain-containing protein n=1 Tax=Solirubrum puertoriconensis TaxID=1751427 RepID=A0A9X0HN52_SOLP1|nr:hypothetical protein [Solirubrum puertoriconensis]KUG09046.1 hypothetical protein ASU33_19675 [Solirubrum puertoriconensis]